MTTHSRKTILLATDQQRSVLSALDEHQPRSIAYTPYGHRPRENGLLSLLGFNGELPDPRTGCYHLGNGYRQFNPVLMRFNSPDSWSPFGEGGLNAYGYCGGDPRNREDRNGHQFLHSLFKPFKKPGFIKSSIKTRLTQKLNDKETPFNIEITTFSTNKVTSQRESTVIKQTASMTGRKITLNRTMKDNQFIHTTKQRVFVSRSQDMHSYGKQHTTGFKLNENYANNHLLHVNVSKINQKIGNSSEKSINREIEKLRKMINSDDVSRLYQERS